LRQRMAPPFAAKRLRHQLAITRRARRPTREANMTISWDQFGRDRLARSSSLTRTS
jgi:hypothetical protein